MPVDAGAGRNTFPAGQAAGRREIEGRPGVGEEEGTPDPAAAGAAAAADAAVVVGAAAAAAADAECPEAGRRSRRCLERRNAGRWGSHEDLGGQAAVHRKEVESRGSEGE